MGHGLCVATRGIGHGLCVCDATRGIGHGLCATMTAELSLCAGVNAERSETAQIRTRRTNVTTASHLFICCLQAK